MPKRNRSKKNVLKNISDASMKKLNALKKKLLQGGEGEGVENAALGAATGATTKVDSVGRPEPVAEDLRDTGAMAIRPAESVADNAQVVTSDASATGAAAATGAQSERSISNLWGLLSGGKSKRRNRNNSKRNRSQRKRKHNSKKRN
jgi:hypothetical protein